MVCKHENINYHTNLLSIYHRWWRVLYSICSRGLAKLGHDVWVYSLGLENEKKVINGVHIIREYMPESSEYYFTRIKGTANEVIQTKNIYKIMHKQIDLMYSPRIYKNSKA